MKISPRKHNEASRDSAQCGPGQAAYLDITPQCWEPERALPTLFIFSRSLGALSWTVGPCQTEALLSSSTLNQTHERGFFY